MREGTCGISVSYLVQYEMQIILPGCLVPIYIMLETHQNGIGLLSRIENAVPCSILSTISPLNSSFRVK